MADLATAAFDFFLAISLSYVLYRSILGFIGLLPHRSRPYAGPGDRRFLIVIPARNEERVIADTIGSVFRLDYPVSGFRVVVVADGCTDSTAARARLAGAEVLERNRRPAGKGVAIRWALGHPSIATDDWDTLVLLDADCAPMRGFLRAMEHGLDGGAESLQGLTIVRPESSLMARAYAVKARIRNRTWHLARERLGLSAALTGSGMCLTRRALTKVPWRTKTLTEDLEYGAYLELAGIRTKYLPEAVSEVDGPNLKASFSQRLRWVRGQVRTAARLSPQLFASAVRNRRPAALDSALYLLMPTLAPLQAGLVALGLLDLFVPGVLPIQPGVIWTGVAFSVAPTLLAPFCDRKGLAPKDMFGYFVLMVSWLPIAMVGAVTARLFDWQPTPHGNGRVLRPAAKEAQASGD